MQKITIIIFFLVCLTSCRATKIKHDYVTDRKKEIIIKIFEVPSQTEMIAVYVGIYDANHKEISKGLTNEKGEYYYRNYDSKISYFKLSYPGFSDIKLIIRRKHKENLENKSLRFKIYWKPNKTNTDLALHIKAQALTAPNFNLQICSILKF